jgi:hypothetical protein
VVTYFEQKIEILTGNLSQCHFPPIKPPTLAVLGAIIGDSNRLSAIYKVSVHILTPGPLTPAGKALFFHCIIGHMGFKTHLQVSEKRNIFYNYRDLNRISSFFKPLA